ncbi:MAG: Two-component transcriptional response regulator, LuxR family [Pseudolabrys sp.]|jgi:FixJ family two-component response regulator|nr:Two-component transcriptional response regulator, LuxR family [Pseudolabrys sp.]
MTAQDYSVFLVDDDKTVRESLAELLEAKGYTVRAFESPTEFLEEHDPAVAGCALIDLAMPELDGLSVQRALSESGCERPVIFLSGHGDLTSGVRAMRAGAVDFLEKPVNSADLMAAIERAARLESELRCRTAEQKAIRARLDRLTRRELEVLKRVIAGRLNKQIAYELGAGEKTVKVHRSRMMTKMGVHTVADLVRMTEKVNLPPSAEAI